MATVMWTAGQVSAERRFYGRMALMIAALVFVGFAPSFYLRGFVHVPRPNPTLTALVIAHGLACTTWIGLFWAQAALVAANRRDLHMRLGLAGMALALLLIPLMYGVTVGQVARANQPPFATPLGWTALPFGTMLSWAALLALGWRHRRDGQAHKRLMLSLTLIFAGPAIGRLPVPPLLPVFAAVQALGLAVFLPLVMWDRRTHGRVHWATTVGIAWAAFAPAFGIVMLGEPAWARFAAQLPGVYLPV